MQLKIGLFSHHLPSIYFNFVIFSWHFRILALYLFNSNLVFDILSWASLSKNFRDLILCPVCWSVLIHSGQIFNSQSKHRMVSVSLCSTHSFKSSSFFSFLFTWSWTISAKTLFLISFPCDMLFLQFGHLFICPHCSQDSDWAIGLGSEATHQVFSHLPISNLAFKQVLNNTWIYIRNF